MSNIGDLGNPISDKDLLKYASCHRSHYMKISHRIPGTGIAEAVLFFRNKRRELFDVRQKGVGELFENGRRAGPQASHIEEMTTEELAKYIPFESGDSFGGHLKGIWFSKVLEKKEDDRKRFYRPNDIYWKFASEPFRLAAQLEIAGKNYYNFIMSHGVPIMGLIDKERTFRFGDIHMKANFPEIRVPNKAKGVTKWSGKSEMDGKDYMIFLDHPSMFSFSGEMIGKDRAESGSSAIITLRLYALSELIKNHPTTYLPKLHAPESYWEYVESTKDAILKNLYFRHINLLTGEMETLTRTDADLSGLERFIKDHILNVSSENFKPNKDSCPSCMYNTLGIDGSPVCHYRNKSHSPTVPRYYFNPKSFKIYRSEGKNSITLNGIVEKSDMIEKIQTEPITVKHKVGNMKISLEDHSDSVIAKAHYSSEVFGINSSNKKKGTFEMRMLSEMDSVMKELAFVKRKPVIGSIEFRYLDFAGKTKSKEKLNELGYSDSGNGTFTKRYSEGIYDEELL